MNTHFDEVDFAPPAREPFPVLTYKCTVYVAKEPKEPIVTYHENYIHARQQAENAKNRGVDYILRERAAPYHVKSWEHYPAAAITKIEINALKEDGR
jgi:hypothetical protein